MRIELTSWNAYSERFVFAPSWAWRHVREAAAYRVMLADENGIVCTASVTRPEWSAAGIWERLLTAPLDMVIRGIDGDGRDVCTPLHRRFRKSPGFDGHRQTPLDWRTAVARNLEHLLAPARDQIAEYEAGLPRSCWSSFEDSITGQRTHLAYPALHHPSFILCYLRFADQYPSDPLAGEATRQAAAYGEWLLSHRQPAEWRYGLLPHSTVKDGRFGGGVEGRNITLFRAARVGEAMLALYRAFSDERYLSYACHLADTFAAMQRGDGSWPYRVDPSDGTVVEEYTSNAITPARFLEMLLAIESREAWTQSRDRAVEWMMSNPVRTNHWQGMYEDVPELPPYSNLQNWDVNELVRYLVHHRAEDDTYLQVAVALNRFVEDQFVLWQTEDGFVHCPTPTVLEQYRCYHPMEVHTGNWLLSLAALHQATGSAETITKAIAAANSIVRGQMVGGAFSTWGNDRRFERPLNTVNWPGCSACASSALMVWDAYYRSLDSDGAVSIGLNSI